MKSIRSLLALLAVAMMTAPAFGMTRAAAPQKFPIPFANNAGGAYITYPTPTPSQIGSGCGLASLTDGFPPLTMQAASSGGCPPRGQDFNGILKQITQWNQQTQAGAVPVFDASFASSIGGYPEGSILSQASFPSCFWISQTDNNSANPDTGGANWTGTCPGGGIATSVSGTNSITIAATPFVIQPYAQVCWTAQATNTAAVQINVNSFGLRNLTQRTQFGNAGLTGGEMIAGTIYCATWDGAQWEISDTSQEASLTVKNQVLFGGAVVSSFDLGTGSGGGTVTINPGNGPLQSILNAGAFTIGAPSADGSVLVMITNTATAGSVGSSGFTVGPNVGDGIDTVNGHRFVLSIWRIAGISSFISKALQ